MIVSQVFGPLRTRTWRRRQGRRRRRPIRRAKRTFRAKRRRR